jgi:hypothetical protein
VTPIHDTADPVFQAVRDAFAANFRDTGLNKAANLAGCSRLPRRVAAGQPEQLVER